MSSTFKSNLSDTLARVSRANLEALRFQPSAPLPLPQESILFVFHVLGWLAAARVLRLPQQLILLPILLWILVWLTFRALKRNLSVSVLSPLFLVYAVLVIRFVYIRVFHFVVPGYFDYLVPDSRLPFLNLDAATVAAFGLIVINICLVSTQTERRSVLLVTALAVALTGVWASGAYLANRSSGATGSDPYVYVQMGVDLATRGSPAHKFGLFPAFAGSQLPWYPLIHTGYHLPFNSQGDAVSVWPIGASFTYALAYRLLGEPAVYWVNPLFSIACALAAGLLARETLRLQPLTWRLATAAGTIVLVATANEQVTWSTVPMADAQAEFFSIMTLYFAFRSQRHSGNAAGVLAGVSLAAAYWVRHTQLILAACLVVIYLWNRNVNGRAFRNLVFSGLIALILALPDLWYHQSYLGGWLHPESEELALFSFSAVGTTGGQLMLQFLAGREFGWLLPFLVYGGVQLARRARIEFLALALWVALAILIHLPYSAVRLRDLLPEFPAVALFAAYGVASLFADLAGSRRAAIKLAAGLAVLAAADLFVLRDWNTVTEAWIRPTAAFGYLTQAQRESFGRIDTLVPEQAVLGSELNDGAIDLYARRSTFRPAVWTPAELRTFLGILRDRQQEAYLLEDSRAQSAVIADLSRDLNMFLIATLDVPLAGDGQIDQPGAIWRIENR